MIEQLLYYLAVFLMAGLKFIPAVVMSVPMDLASRIVVLVLGGTTGVLVFTYSGAWIRRKLKRFKLRSRKEKTGESRTDWLWKRYGLLGVAILVPFLMPAVATGIALSFGAKKQRIILYMVPSIVIWAVILALFAEQLKTYLDTYWF